MSTGVGIISWGGLSALGGEQEQIWAQYLEEKSKLRWIPDLKAWGGPLSNDQEERLKKCREQSKLYGKLDRTVLLALLAAEKAIAPLSNSPEYRWGVNLGSSRGATEKLESYHAAFLSKERLSPNASPLTTLGNISTWVSRHLGLHALNISHSITCSTASHALLNGLAWLESGRCDYFLAGGAEAPLSSFTIAQMQALRIYAGKKEVFYPNLSLDIEKASNSMVLGEGAACFVLSKKHTARPLAWIAGVGYAMEKISSPSGISATGEALQKSMKMALQEAQLETVDGIVCHSPGTIRGDLAEWQAIQTVFGKNIPLLTTNKWKIGHTLGASGGLSLEMALLMLKHQQFIGIPFGPLKNQRQPKELRTLMVNATGFGGNAVSFLIMKNEE